MSDRIAAMKRTNFIAFLSMVVFQAVMLIMIKKVIDVLRYELQMEDYVYYAIFAVLAICFILTDAYFYKKRIYKVNCLSAERPLRCTIEDLVAYAHPGFGKRSYRIYPILKNTDTGELMFTYDKYWLGGYQTRYMYVNNRPTHARIFRSDNSIVKVGDVAEVYVLKPLPVQVTINERRNMVKLNRFKMKFVHENENYDINVFNELRYFEGLVDVEIAVPGETDAKDWINY